jgi:cell shape-determining protein MreC
MSDNDLQRRIETGIEREKQRVWRNSLIVNLLVFAILVPLLWILELTSINGGPLVAFLLTIAWFFTTATQFVAYRYNLPAKSRQLRERIEQLEYLNEQIRQREDQLAEKPKRHQHLRLSDEGELIPVDDELDDESLKRAHQG